MDDVQVLSAQSVESASIMGACLILSTLWPRKLVQTANVTMTDSANSAEHLSAQEYFAMETNNASQSHVLIIFAPSPLLILRLAPKMLKPLAESATESNAMTMQTFSVKTDSAMRMHSM